MHTAIEVVLAAEYIWCGFKLALMTTANGRSRRFKAGLVYSILPFPIDFIKGYFESKRVSKLEKKLEEIKVDKKERERIEDKLYNDMAFLNYKTLDHYVNTP